MERKNTAPKQRRPHIHKGSNTPQTVTAQRADEHRRFCTPWRRYAHDPAPPAEEASVMLRPYTYDISMHPPTLDASSPFQLLLLLPLLLL